MEPQYIREDILPHFFRHFWNHRMALDRRNYRQVYTIINNNYEGHILMSFLFIII